jgi:hypothetical protein
LNDPKQIVSTLKKSGVFKEGLTGRGKAELLSETVGRLSLVFGCFFFKGKVIVISFPGIVPDANKGKPE